jgi:hypothetical protein
MRAAAPRAAPLDTADPPVGGRPGAAAGADEGARGTPAPPARPGVAADACPALPPRALTWERVPLAGSGGAGGQPRSEGAQTWLAESPSCEYPDLTLLAHTWGQATAAGRKVEGLGVRLWAATGVEERAAGRG